MELTFETVQQIAQGSNPAAVHFQDNTAQAFYVGDDGRLRGIKTDTPAGEWADRGFSDPVVVTRDLNIDYFTLRRISRYGMYGTWLSENRHRFIIYQYEYRVDTYVEDGSISTNIDSPIVMFSLNVSNPDYVFVNENELGFLSPGSKVSLTFRAGDSEGFNLGTYYVDKSKFNVTGNDVSASGVNGIGKYLKDQTFDENNTFSPKVFPQLITDILNAAGVPPEKYAVDSRGTYTIGMQFPPNMEVLEGLKETLKTVRNWKIAETLDGIIAVGFNSFEKFDQPQRYTFYRDKDVFSREITRDDNETYRRVCVHTSDFAVKSYQNILNYENWGMGAHKTLYVTVPTGTTQADADEYALELAERLSMTGIIESFVGPFRPQLQSGDEAEIVNSDGISKLIGLVTSVNQRFGKRGFYTEFTVDSGGLKGKGRISDFIEKITQKGAKGSATRLYP